MGAKKMIAVAGSSGTMSAPGLGTATNATLLPLGEVDSMERNGTSYHHQNRAPKHVSNIQI